MNNEFTGFQVDVVRTSPALHLPDV